MITLALLFALYFLPTIVASHRGQRVGGIFLLNLLFGWTGIGWFALLLYALLAFPRVYGYAPGRLQQRQVQRLAELLAARRDTQPAAAPLVHS